MPRKTLYTMLLNIFLMISSAYAQDADITEMQAKNWLSELAGKIENEVGKNQLQVEKWLTKMIQEEQKLKRISQTTLHKSVGRNAETVDSIDWKTSFHSEVIELNKYQIPYSSRLDSLQSLLGFIKSKYSSLPDLASCESNLNKLKGQLDQLNQLEKQLAKRKDVLRNWIMQQANQIPYLKAFKDWQIQAEALQLEIREWKETINNPEKIEKAALALANKIPAFQAFMQQNGELARLFGPVGGGNNAGNAAQLIPGLQTRASLQQELINRFGQNALQSGGALQQQMQAGMQQIADLQNQLAAELNNRLGSSPAELSPAQKEKAALKSKTIKERLEFGWNLQSATRVQNFPAVRDVGLSFGYKLNPRFVIGVGVAYKFALGESWKNIQWTHEGIGLRSFVDWRMTDAGGKLFKNIWLTGGFEMNYWERIGNNAQWKELAWQKSGLVGVSKKIEIKRKVLKIQLLWDMYNNHDNNTQNFIFRTGTSL